MAWGERRRQIRWIVPINENWTCISLTTHECIIKGMQILLYEEFFILFVGSYNKTSQLS